jgi:hypothetical protein
MNPVLSVFCILAMMLFKNGVPGGLGQGGGNARPGRLKVLLAQMLTVLVYWCVLTVEVSQWLVVQRLEACAQDS